MRVTSAMLSQLVSSAHQSAKSATLDPTMRLTTGRRVLTPSDDPAAARRIGDLDAALAKLGRMGSTRQSLMADLSMADTALAEAANTIGDAHSLALQMASDPIAAGDRADAAIRVRALRDQLAGLFNRPQPDGTYLFSGVAEDQPPYDPTTGEYLGSTVNRQVEIAPGVFVDGTLSGDDALGEPADAFAALDALATALENDDVVGVRDAIDLLDASIEQVGSAQAGIGYKIQAVEHAEGLSAELEFQHLGERSELADVDLAEELTNLSLAETSMTVVMEVTKRFMSMNLAKFL